MTTIPEAGWRGAVQAVLHRAPFVSRVHCHDEIGSTSDAALALARAGAPHGTLVLADRQTAGRGRFGRPWESPPGLGLWMSWILRPGRPLAEAFAVNAVMALAVLDTAQLATGRRAALRWPNDVVVGGRKLCGLLAESAAAGERLEVLVAGVGLNVNQQPADFPADLAGEATSLAQMAGRPLDRALVLALFVEALDRCWTMLDRRGAGAVLDHWRRHSLFLDREVDVDEGGRSWRGTARDLADDGALIVEMADGTRRTLRAGDVRLIRPAAGSSDPKP